MRSPRPPTAVRTLSAVETPASSGLYPPGLNRVAMPPKAQIPRLVFTGRPYRLGRANTCPHAFAQEPFGSSIWRAERPARATGGKRGASRARDGAGQVEEGA